MSLVVMILTVFSVAQGDAFRVSYPDRAGVESAYVEWGTRTVPLSSSGNGWTTVVGADLDLAPGDYPIRAVFVYADGRRVERLDTVTVGSKSFPLTRLTVEPQYVELSPEDAERANRESRRLGAVFAEISPERLWDGPFTVPIPDSEGSNFGHRRVFNDQPRNPHSGADISAVSGTPIHATNRGRVVETGDYFFNGNTVILDHGFGIYSVYLHLSRIDVETGQMVERDEVLGLVGATGRVTGPHLHWGFRVQNARVDPFSMTRVE